MRRLILRFMPGRMKQLAEAESRQWIGTCQHCNCQNSIWDLGGLRYGAAGRPTKLARCPNCSRIGLHKFEKRG